MEHRKCGLARNFIYNLDFFDTRQTYTHALQHSKHTAHYSIRDDTHMTSMKIVSK